MDSPTELVRSSYSPFPYTVFIICLLFILLLSFQLSPSPEGHGTHCQLGLPACGFLTVTGYPCPSCGLTTSFSYLVRGQVLKSLQTQPFGTVFLATLTAFGIISLIAAVKRIPVSYFLDSAVFDRIQIFLLALFFISWIYKICVML